MLYTILVFAPLVGALIAGLFGRMIGDRASQVVTCGFMALSAACAIASFFLNIYGEPFKVVLFDWIVVGSFDTQWALRIDGLSASMMLVVSFISFLIHVYSVGYMAEDASIPRFMSYLSLFTFAMLMLVTSDNLIQLFFGWEGVGVASYLLIGFWYDRASACAAAMKAFIVNRVGDFGLILGIAACYLVFDSVQYDVIFANAASFADSTIVVFGYEFNTLTIIGVLLFIGAMGKSAQLGLHTWLPDAMEGPTPVSALIHAATMVTAGVFLVARFSPLYEYAPTALAMVAFIGASTAFFAATIGMVQNDIKRVIAYSTCSQLGYMFFACGVSAYSAGVFHLFTHAFFKALLFLGAGSVIHAMHHEQDMRKMGGIWNKIPITYAMMWIGSLALMGIPFFAGYYSKDAILEAAWASHAPFARYAFWLGIGAAFLTAFYSGRLLWLTFHGTPRADHHTMEHVHESPMVMLVPLFCLAGGALFAGWLAQGMIAPDAAWWSGAIFMRGEPNILEELHHVPTLVRFAPLIVGVAGFGLSLVLYLLVPSVPGRIAAALRPVYLFLLNKWYFDELYDRIFVQPAKAVGSVFWRGGDGLVIDGFGPDGVAAATGRLARQTARLQTGYVYHYAFAMLIGVAALVTWYLFFVR
ncbi:NADH-quinone oxidoreductase subunit L [Geminicoccus harenae]|uniref:NADH-quinone oxidoreductase subunit L n=1 Tax=Geminicoccus harenae TaxID=2498453 RepID=UPI00168AAE7A|nr:NADH-quinone oxidoreductase subunit L [Geminicoccus harenae]